MKISFRVECPFCKWGYKILSSHINQGYLKTVCLHCRNRFYFKIAITGVQIDVQKELTNDIPCRDIIKDNKV